MEGKSRLNMPPFQYYLRKFWYLLDCGTSCLKVKVAPLCLTLCGPMDCSLPGSSVHGIFQARILEWVAIPSSRRSCQPRDWTQASHTGGGFLTVWATREALKALVKAIKKKKKTSWVTWYFPSPGNLGCCLRHETFIAKIGSNHSKLGKAGHFARYSWSIISAVLANNVINLNTELAEKQAFFFFVLGPWYNKFCQPSDTYLLRLSDSNTENIIYMPN